MVCVPAVTVWLQWQLDQVFRQIEAISETSVGCFEVAFVTLCWSVVELRESFLQLLKYGASQCLCPEDKNSTSEANKSKSWEFLWHCFALGLLRKTKEQELWWVFFEKCNACLIAFQQDPQGACTTTNSLLVLWFVSESHDKGGGRKERCFRYLFEGWAFVSPFADGVFWGCQFSTHLRRVSRRWRV